MDDSMLRTTLLQFLEQAVAHLKVKDALKELKRGNRHRVAVPTMKTIWEELEHMRIAQEDILRFTLDPNWQSPKWPAGYWPETTQQITDEQWQNTVDRFFSDLQDVVAMVKNPLFNLTAEIPHGNGQTYLREILLIIDHNAYHLAKIVQTRKMLGDWNN